MYWNSKFLENAAVQGDTEDTELGLMYVTLWKPAAQNTIFKMSQIVFVLSNYYT